MRARPPFRRAARTLAFLLAFGAAAQAPAAEAEAGNSALDAPLFYQLLIGEIELREGQAGAAHEVLIDAARKTRNEQLFRRATDVALQARAGDSALAAIQAWRTALPESLEAQRYLVQLLVALNRVPETTEPLRSLLALTPAAERVDTLAALPRFYARAADRRLGARVLEQVLPPYLEAPATRTAARVALGRTWLGASDAERALDQARRAHGEDPQATAPALLALELMSSRPEAESIVVSHLQARPDDSALRLAYVRALNNAQRHADAIGQLQAATRSEPGLTPAWLTLGALYLELRQPREAQAALQEALRLLQSGTRPAAPGAQDDDDGAEEPGTQGALAQVYLMLARTAELRGDFSAAESWLARVDNPQRALDVQPRRASLLSRQGRMAEARELIRSVPEQGPQELRAKLLAEAHLLREAKLWSEADTVLARANLAFVDDADLLYEQSMVAEKLQRPDEMERLLRRVIELKPDHHHAYNALGYSLAERNLRLDEARELIRKALALMPGEPFITDSLGWVEFRLGNRQEALRLLQSAYKSRPDTEIAAHLGEVLWVGGQREEARRIWRDARSRDETNDVLRETLARLQVDL